jgi:hypothetical protein
VIDIDREQRHDPAGRDDLRAAPARAGARRWALTPPLDVTGRARKRRAARAAGGDVELPVAVDVGDRDLHVVLLADRAGDDRRRPRARGEQLRRIGRGEVDRERLAGLRRAHHVDVTIAVDIRELRVLGAVRVAERTNDDGRPRLIDERASWPQRDGDLAALLPRRRDVEIAVPVDVREVDAVGADRAVVDRVHRPGRREVDHARRRIRRRIGRGVGHPAVLRADAHALEQHAETRLRRGTGRQEYDESDGAHEQRLAADRPTGRLAPGSVRVAADRPTVAPGEVHDEPLAFVAVHLIERAVAVLDDLDGRRTAAAATGPSCRRPAARSRRARLG